MNDIIDRIIKLGECVHPHELHDFKIKTIRENFGKTGTTVEFLKTLTIVNENNIERKRSELLSKAVDDYKNCVDGVMMMLKETEKKKKTKSPKTASDILDEASSTIKSRGEERDKGSERSMKTTVEAFNALTGQTMTETQGWQFMAILKLARVNGGSFKLDDYLDGAAYMALAGECELNNQS